MSTKHHFTEMERDYHDAFTYLRLIRKVESTANREGGMDYFDTIHYLNCKAEFDACLPEARRAARRSLSMRGEQ